jgi:hypothetical protein
LWLVQPKQPAERRGLELQQLAVPVQQQALLRFPPVAPAQQNLLPPDCRQLELLLLAQLVLALVQWKILHLTMGRVLEHSPLRCWYLLVRQV